MNILERCFIRRLFCSIGKHTLFKGTVQVFFPFGQFSFLQQTAGPADTEILLLLIDSSIVEIFVNQGEIVFTTRIYLEKNEREISFQQWENISLETVKE